MFILLYKQCNCYNHWSRSIKDYNLRCYLIIWSEDVNISANLIKHLVYFVKFRLDQILTLRWPAPATPRFDSRNAKNGSWWQWLTDLMGPEQPMRGESYINRRRTSAPQSSLRSEADNILIMFSKYLSVASKLKKISTFLKHQKRKLKKTEDLEIYVDSSWEFTTKARAEKGSSFSERLSVLPYHDVLGDWLDQISGDTCDISTCLGDCQPDQENYYATVFTGHTAQVQDQHSTLCNL